MNATSWILLYIAVIHTTYIATEIWQMKVMVGNWEKAYDKLKQQCWAKDKQIRELAEKFPLVEASESQTVG